MPPLRYRHGTEDVGEIEGLEYDRDGSLRVRARVDLPAARQCPAFSVCAKVLDYEIINEHSRDFHALIKRAEIIEISLTDQPACPAALVDARWPVPAHREYYKNATRVVGVLQKMLTVLGDEMARAAADKQKVTPAAAPRRPVIAPPRRPTPFSALVEAINR